jgi:hypothetical protein
VATNSRASPELLEQGAGAEAAVAGQAGGDPVEVAVLRRQDVRLLVVEVLDPVLDPAQQV